MKILLYITAVSFIYFFKSVSSQGTDVAIPTNELQSPVQFIGTSVACGDHAKNCEGIENHVTDLVLLQIWKAFCEGFVKGIVCGNGAQRFIESTALETSN